MKKSALLISMIFVLAGGVALAQTTEFTYQGRLQNASAPATGNHDFQFLLFDALTGGTQALGCFPFSHSRLFFISNYFEPMSIFYGASGTEDFFSRRCI
jgi:hypothetical protein